MNNIYLVGFMGTGKSAVGEELSRQCGLAYVDLDELIEQRQGISIAEIFSSQGEQSFRRAESGALRDVSAGAGQVISCGGGIVLDPENVRVMKETGIVVCLTARAEVIHERTKGSRRRPLLDVEDPVRRIAELLVRRAPAYARADHTVDTSDKTVPQVCAEIRSVVP